MHRQLCFKRLVINLLYISLLNLYFSQDLKSKVDLRVLYKTGQTTQWPKEKGQYDNQRSTKHTQKTKDRVTRNPYII
jgi:hypothetical protein